MEDVSVLRLLPLDACVGLTDPVELGSCVADATDSVDSECTQCMIAALTPDQVECVMACFCGESCGSCVRESLKRVLDGCFPLIASPDPLRMRSMKSNVAGAQCSLSDEQISTLPLDLYDCYAASAAGAPSACIAERGYTASGDCYTCLFVVDADLCDCSDPHSGSCVQCVLDRVMRVMLSCAPQWDHRFSLPSPGADQCSLDDLVELPAEDDFISLLGCLHTSADQAACWTSNVSENCSACIDAVMQRVPSGCTGACLTKIAAAVLGRCLGVVSSPQPADCSEDDYALFSQAEVDSAVLGCNLSHPDDVATCLDVSAIGTLSADCRECLQSSQPWSSDASCATSCSIEENTGAVSCTPADAACVADSVSTSFCFDAEGLASIAEAERFIPSACTLKDLAVIAEPFTQAEVNACFIETHSDDAYKCLTSAIPDSSRCMECVIVTLSLVTGCANQCDVAHTAPSCFGCVETAVATAIGECAARGAPVYAAHLSSAQSAFAVSSLFFAGILLQLEM